MSALSELIQKMLREEVERVVREELLPSNGNGHERLPVAMPITAPAPLPPVVEPAMPPTRMPRRQRVGKRDLWVGDVVNGRKILRLKGKGAKGQVLVVARCEACGLERRVSAESVVRHGCTACASRSRGSEPGLKALDETLRMTSTALGEVLLKILPPTGPTVVSAGDLRARLVIIGHVWREVAGGDVPDARLLGRALVALSQVPPPGLMVSLAERGRQGGRSGKGSIYRIERVAARMP